MSLENQIKQVVSTEFGIPLEDVGSDLKYGEAPEWDSASHMVLVIALEETFGIEFDPDEIVSLTSLGQIQEALTAKGISASPNA